jgi:Immunoglobulin domain/PQQ-like domain/IPT/TIG domain
VDVCHLRTGEFLAGGPIFSSPALVAGGAVYFTSWNGKVYAVDSATGSETWEFFAGGNVNSSPAIGQDGVLYLGSQDHNLYALGQGQFAPAPAPLSLLPASGFDTGAVDVVIAGKSFSTNAVVELRLAGQSAIVASNLTVVSASNITCTLPLAGKADGPWNLVVVNGDGQAGSLLNAFAVNPVATAPVITAQPQSQAVTVGASATFRVTAGGTPPLSYEWKKDGTPIPDAAGPMLLITNVQAGDVGVYNVLVSNRGGSVTSSNALLTVQQASLVNLSNPRFSTNAFVVTVSTQAGHNHVLEYKNALADPVWTPVQTKPGTGGLVDFTDTAANGVARYYRIRVE